MGQKVNPHGLRVGVIKDWDSRWYAREDKVGDLIVEDYKIREYLKKTLYSAGVPTIEIERDSAKVRIYIHCSRPGVAIGKGGAEIERLRLEVEKMIGKPVALSIVEVRTPDTNAQLVAENIAQQLEKRIGFRRAMKTAMGRAMRVGAVRRPAWLRGDSEKRVLPRGYHSSSDHPCRHRLRLCRGEHDLWPYRRQGLDLQRRGPFPDPAHHPAHHGSEQARRRASPQR